MELKFYRHITEYDPRWERILSELQTTGYCSPEHKEALLNWPEHLKSIKTLFSNEAEPAFKPVLNHAKIFFLDGEMHAAKVYYGYCLDWN